MKIFVAIRIPPFLPVRMRKLLFSRKSQVGVHLHNISSQLTRSLIISLRKSFSSCPLRSIRQNVVNIVTTTFVSTFLIAKRRYSANGNILIIIFFWSQLYNTLNVPLYPLNFTRWHLTILWASADNGKIDNSAIYASGSEVQNNDALESDRCSNFLSASVVNPGHSLSLGLLECVIQYVRVRALCIDGRCLSVCLSVRLSLSCLTLTREWKGVGSRNWRKKAHETGGNPWPPSKVKVTRPINVVTNNQPYLRNGKAYDLQTWYADKYDDSHHWYAAVTT